MVDDVTPAFPTGDHRECPAEPGMTLRDWFAGQVIAGLYSVEGLTNDIGDDVVEADARFSYRVADAMMEARKD